MDISTILKTYRLHPLTFSRLKSRLISEPKVTWGKIDYTLDPADDILLSSAGVCPSTYKLRTKQVNFPFYRFFVYCVFTIPESDFCQQFFERNLLLNCPRTKNWLLQQRTLFISECLPPVLVKTTQKAKEPTKIGADHWRSCCDILEISDIFEDPDLFSNFDEVLYAPEVKSLIEFFLTTNYPSENDILKVLNRYSDLSWEVNEGYLYHHYFYDISDLDTTDWKFYLGLIHEREASIKRKVKETALDQVMIEKGLIWEEKVTALLSDAIKSYTQVYYEGKQLGTGDGLKMAKDALDLILKAKDRLDAITGGSSVLSEALVNFKIRREEYAKKTESLGSKTQKKVQDGGGSISD